MRLHRSACHIRLLGVLVSAALLAGACGGDADESGGGDPSAEAIVDADATTDAGASDTAPGPNEDATEPDEVAETDTATDEETDDVAEPTEVAVRPTIDDLLASEEPLNIAHAGGDQDAPHSTLYAFGEAVAAGADMLEIDVQLTGDGVLVVQHDDTVDKTTETTGRVDALTYEELFALDNAHWFSPECWPCQDRPLEEYVYRGIRTGEVPPPEGYVADDFAVPTFRALVERFPTMPIDIEIKGSFPDAVPVAEVLAAEIAELGLTENVVVVSFDDQLLAAFEELAPEVETSPGVGEMSSWILAGVPLEGHRIVQVPPAFDGVQVLTPDFWSLTADAGVDVWVWPDDPATQENQAFYEQLIADGAAGVIAGRPAQMSAAVEATS